MLHVSGQMSSAATNMPSMVNAIAIFTAVPSSKPIHVARPTGSLKVAQCHVLANCGADQWHEYESPEAGKDTEQGAEHCSDYSLPARTDALGAKSGGYIIGNQAHHGQERGDAYSPRGDIRKIVDPGTEKDATEDQHSARQNRQDDPCKTQHHEGRNDGPQKNFKHRRGSPPRYRMRASTKHVLPATW